MNEILEQALPFWESLTDKQKEEIRNNMVKTECQKKTQLHFGGGECAGVQIIGKGRVRVFITSPGGKYAVWKNPEIKLTSFSQHTENGQVTPLSANTFLSL